MGRLSRRNFIKGTVATAAAACCAAGRGPLGPSLCYGQSAAGNGRTAVFINQYGGNDPLNSFAVPYTVSTYYDRRPTLAIDANTVLPMSNGIGLNPVLTALKTAYDAGDVAVIQGAGDPIGTRSHFTSQEFFSKGITDLSAIDQRGWIGRLGDLYLSAVPYNTFGLGVGQQSDFEASRGTNRPIIASSLSSYGFTNDSTSSTDNTYRRNLVQTLLNASKTRGVRQQAARSGEQAVYSSASTISSVVSSYSSVVTYPGTGIGSYLRDAARLIRFGLGTVVTYGGLGGWDTHSDQRSSQDPVLTQINAAVSSFRQDLINMNKWNDTVICIFSEFGRNTFENDSGGTDHGWGSAMVVIGGSVNGGVYGATPTAAEIANQPWIYEDIDFRNVLSGIINWLGFDPTPVFPESYSKLSLPII